MLVGTCLRMLATLPPYEAHLLPRSKFWLVFAAICFSLKKSVFHVKILGWPAMGRELHAAGDVSAHARYAAALRGAPPAAHQVLARLCRQHDGQHRPSRTHHHVNQGGREGKGNGDGDKRRGGGTLVLHT